MKYGLELNSLINEIDINKYKLSNIDTCYYIPNFISKMDENKILDIINNKIPKNIWTKLKRRRLLCFGGQPNNKENFKLEKLPLFCDIIVNYILKHKYLI